MSIIRWLVMSSNSVLHNMQGSSLLILFCTICKVLPIRCKRWQLAVERSGPVVMWPWRAAGWPNQRRGVSVGSTEYDYVIDHLWVHSLIPSTECWYRPRSWKTHSWADTTTQDLPRLQIHCNSACSSNGCIKACELWIGCMASVCFIRKCCCIKETTLLE